MKLNGSPGWGGGKATQSASAPPPTPTLLGSDTAYTCFYDTWKHRRNPVGESEERGKLLETLALCISEFPRPAISDTLDFLVAVNPLPSGVSPHFWVVLLFSATMGHTSPQ